MRKVSENEWGFLNRICLNCSWIFFSSDQADDVLIFLNFIHYIPGGHLAPHADLVKVVVTVEHPVHQVLVPIGALAAATALPQILISHLLFPTEPGFFL